MARELELFSKDLNIISALDNEPNDVGGLSPSELKAKFDEAGLSIQSYINDVLIPVILEEFSKVDSSIGISPESAAVLGLGEDATLNDAVQALATLAQSGGIPTAEFVAVCKETAELFSVEGRSNVDAILRVINDKIAESSALGYTKTETLSPSTKTALGLGEDATPDDAFNAMQPRVGDILYTARADLDEKWLLCNGDEIGSSEYPALFDVLPSAEKPNIAETNDKAGGLKYKYLGGKHIICRRGNVAVTDENGANTRWITKYDTAGVVDVEYHDGVWAVCLYNGKVLYTTDFTTWTEVTHIHALYGKCLKYANGKWIYGATTNGPNTELNAKGGVGVYFWGDTIDTLFSNHKIMATDQIEGGGTYAEEYDGKVFVSFGIKGEYYTEDFETWTKLGISLGSNRSMLSMGKAGEYYMFLTAPYLVSTTPYWTTIYYSKDLVTFENVVVQHTLITVAYAHGYYWVFWNDAYGGNQATTCYYYVEDIANVNSAPSKALSLYRYGSDGSSFSTSFPNGETVYLAGWKGNNPTSADISGNSGRLEIGELLKGIPNISVNNAYTYIKAKE